MFPQDAFNTQEKAKPGPGKEGGAGPGLRATGQAAGAGLRGWRGSWAARVGTWPGTGGLDPLDLPSGPT